MFRIPLSYTQIDYKALTHLLQQYEGKDHVQLVEDFESAISSSVGVKHAVCLQSGTAALHIALQLAGVGAGDYVVVPSFTYIGSVNPVLYQGAIPVFVDCDPVTWNMDLNLVEEAFKKLSNEGKKIKALMVVHNYGNPNDIDLFRALANRWGARVIEDAAEALGSTWKGSPVGTSGLGVISFNNNKINTTFGGSVLLTNEVSEHSRAKYLASHARENLPYYEHRKVGYNYRMGSLNAAYGLSQWSKAASNVELRRQVFQNYRSSLEKLSIEFPRELTGGVTNRWLSTFSFPGREIGSIVTRLKSHSIETRPLWNPLHCQPLFDGARSFDRGIGLGLFKSGICLPSSHNLAIKQQREIIDLIHQKQYGIDPRL